jgi:hypothetical protein
LLSPFLFGKDSGRAKISRMARHHLVFGACTQRRLIQPCPQVEIGFQFFIGYFDANGTYVDDIFAVTARYGLSIHNFGFDFTSSLPWSFLDFWAYQALPISTFDYLYIYTITYLYT